MGCGSMAMTLEPATFFKKHVLMRAEPRGKGHERNNSCATMCSLFIP